MLLGQPGHSSIVPLLASYRQIGYKIIIMTPNPLLPPTLASGEWRKRAPLRLSKKRDSPCRLWRYDSGRSLPSFGSENNSMPCLKLRHDWAITLLCSIKWLSLVRFLQAAPPTTCSPRLPDPPRNYTHRPGNWVNCQKV